MPVFLLLVLGQLLWSADAPLVSTPVDAPRATLRVLDQPRARTRWAGSPYATLAATNWGRKLAQDVDQRPGFFQLLRQLLPIERGALAVQVTDGQAFGELTATLGADAPAEFGFPVTQRQATGLHAHVPLAPYALETLFMRREPLAWSSLALLPPAATAGAARPEADLEVTLIPPLPQLATTSVLRASWTVTAYGMHEQAQLSTLPVVPADRQLPVAVSGAQLADLPPTTTWAVATAALPGVAERLPGFDAAVYDAWAATQQLPPWSTVRTTLGGALLWSEPGVPLPSFSLVVELPQALGETLLTWLDVHRQFSPNGDGTHLGVFGFIPLQAGWRDGKLVITTHGGGIAAALTHPGGFTKQPEIVRAMAEAKRTTGDQLVFGASRSSESWGAIASLAPWLLRGRPVYATLAADLRQAGKFGFVSLTRTAESLDLDAGGLFGGPLANAAILQTFMQLTLNIQAPPAEPPPPAKLTEY